MPNHQSAAFSFQLLLLIESKVANHSSGRLSSRNRKSPAGRIFVSVSGRGKKKRDLRVIAHVKSLANWPKPTAKPGVFTHHRIGDFALCSYSLLWHRLSYTLPQMSTDCPVNVVGISVVSLCGKAITVLPSASGFARLDLIPGRRRNCLLPIAPPE